MQFDLSAILRLFGDTIRDPAAVASRIKGLRLPHQAGWIVLAVATISVVLLLHIERLLPGSTAQVVGFGGTPILDTVILGALSVMMVFVFYMMGRSMGGDGSFGATLALMAWFQVFVLVLVVAQVVAAIFLPVLAGVIAIGSLIVQVFVLIHFLNVLHGFDSLLKSAGLMIVSVFGLGFGLAIIVVIIGGLSAVGGA